MAPPSLPFPPSSDCQELLDFFERRGSWGGLEAQVEAMKTRCVYCGGGRGEGGRLMQLFIGEIGELAELLPALLASPAWRCP